MPSALGKALQRLQGLVWGDGVRDSSVYFDGHTLVIDLIGTDSGVPGLTVRGLASNNAPTVLFQINKDGIQSVPGAVVALATVSVAQAAATIDFTSVSQGYRSLKLVGSFRTTAATNAGNLQMQFNGDTAANYDVELVTASAAAITPAEALGQTQINAIAQVPGANSVSGDFGAVEITIPNYVLTTNEKGVLALSGFRAAAGTGNTRVDHAFGLWRSTAAINRVTLLLNSGNFDVGSVATLYGVP